MFFYVSKLFWTLAAPGNLLLSLGIIGLLLQLRPRTARIGRRAAAIALLSLAGVALLPIGNLARAPLEDRFTGAAPLPDGVDGVIVLGGAVDSLMSERRDQPVINDAAERIFALMSLAQRYPQAKLVYSGGSGYVFAQEFKETEVVRGLLAAMGINSARVIYESESRNTFENAVFSKRLAQPQPGETWVLVTSASHMPRSVGIFRAIDWPVVPFPVDYRTPGFSGLEWPMNLHDGLSGLEIAMREWIGLIVYRLTGRSAALFPAP